MKQKTLWRNEPSVEAGLLFTECADWQGRAPKGHSAAVGCLPLTPPVLAPTSMQETRGAHSPACFSGPWHPGALLSSGLSTHTSNGMNLSPVGWGKYFLICSFLGCFPSALKVPAVLPTLAISTVFRVLFSHF